MDQFGAFGIVDTGTSRMTIINPNTNLPYRDAEGNEAWIELAHFDGPEAQAFDAAMGAKRATLKAKGSLDANMVWVVSKLAHLTKAWKLIDANGRVMDVPCTPENAAELYEKPYFRNAVFEHSRAYGNFSEASSTN